MSKVFQLKRETNVDCFLGVEFNECLVINTLDTGFDDILDISTSYKLGITLTGIPNPIQIFTRNEIFHFYNPLFLVFILLFESV